MTQHFIVSTVGPYIFKGYKILQYKFIGINFMKQLSHMFHQADHWWKLYIFIAINFLIFGEIVNLMLSEKEFKIILSCSFFHFLHAAVPDSFLFLYSEPLFICTLDYPEQNFKQVKSDYWAHDPFFVNAVILHG